MATLQPTFAAKGYGCLILVMVFGAIRRAVFDLAGENITYEFTKLDGVAGTGKALV
jgi:hypothetical protein